MTLFQLAAAIALLVTGLAATSIVAIRLHRRKHRRLSPRLEGPQIPGAGSLASKRGSPSRMRSITTERVLGAETRLEPLLQESSYFRAVEARLEQGFELYSRRRISIDTYVAMIEQMLVEARSEAARLSAMPADPAAPVGEDALAELHRALDALEWCRTWSHAQRTQSGADAAA